MVDGVRKLISHLFDIPKQMTAELLFDQSVFVKQAINTVLHESMIGLVLTSIMILLFLGNFRATTAVLLSIPLSALATFVVLNAMNATVNTMILGGLALAFSRVIDNSVISTRKHLSPPGTGCDTPGGGSRGRSRGNVGRLRGNPGCGSRLLPRDLSLWCQQISLFGAGSVLLHFADCVFCGGDDRDSTLLLALSQVRAPHRIFPPDGWRKSMRLI